MLVISHLLLDGLNVSKSEHPKYYLTTVNPPEWYEMNLSTQLSIMLLGYIHRSTGGFCTDYEAIIQQIYPDTESCVVVKN